jgi:hypothetical protein
MHQIFRHRKSTIVYSVYLIRSNRIITICRVLKVKGPDILPKMEEVNF